MNRLKAVFIGSLLGWVSAVSVSQALQLHTGEYTQADIQRGAQLFSTRCTTCHGDAGDQVPGVNLLSGRFRRATSDDDLAAIIKNGIAGTAMPQGNYTNEELIGLVAYLRSAPAGARGAAGSSLPAVNVGTGDPQRGRTLFLGKAECATCHRVNGEGGFRGPNLSQVGSARTPDSLLESLLNPSVEIIPLNQEVRVVTRSGQTFTGRRMNESTSSIQLMDAEGRLKSFLKADLQSLTPVTTSAMPSYRDRLTTGELADVLAYLRSLKPSE